MTAVNPSGAYSQAGVDIDSGNRAVELMRAAVQSTYTPAVLAGIGAFGGAYALGDEVLIASTDSVGTKLRLNTLLGLHRSVGLDLVNHCVNDILTSGSTPLFFLDYFATSRLDPEVAAAVVEGIAEACQVAGCALLGGETAELPGMYAPGEYDVAGFIVGRVARDRLIDGSGIEAGDVLLALPSSGPHTNGFSLVHRILSRFGSGAELAEWLTTYNQDLAAVPADLLLAPHRSYLPELRPLLDTRVIKGMAHITQGGLLENLPRALPAGLSARVDLGSWQVPQVFTWLQREGDVSATEMYRVFNMGVGMVLVVSSADAPSVLRRLEGAWLLGSVVEGDGRVELVTGSDA